MRDCPIHAWTGAGIFIACGLLSPLWGDQLTLSLDRLTVYDSVNNITWLANADLPASNRFTLPPCNGTGVGSRACVNASGSMNYQSAVAWVAAMNAANYLGHRDWQLPTTPITDKACAKVGPNGGSFGFGCTAGALDSMFNALGLKPPNTAVPIAANPVGPFTNVQPYLYWSQSSAGPTSGNQTFAFVTGWQGANTLPNFLYIWPMVPGKLPGASSTTGTGLQASADGLTVYDPMTNITWLANANLAATNPFGLPVCQDPTTPALCVAQDGSMTYASATQYIANMNSAAYLGQKNWQLPTIDANCTNYNCAGTGNPMGNLFYSQFGLSQGGSVMVPAIASVGPFQQIQPYLYWTCLGATIQSACEASGPVANQEWSFSFGSGFQGTDVLQNSLFVTAYFVGNRASATGPVIVEVANAEGEVPTIAPNTWIEVKGVSLAPFQDARTWGNSDFVGGQLPTALDGVSVTVNGKSAYVYYISPTQVNVLTPPDAMSGAVQVVVTNNALPTAEFTAQAEPLSPSFFVFGGGPYVAALHADYSLLGPSRMSAPGYMFAPARPGETVLLYANGFGPTSVPVVSGAMTQSGTLSPPPLVTIGGVQAEVTYAGLLFPGEFQFNVVIPQLGNGDQPIIATYGGASTQTGALITIQK